MDKISDPIKSGHCRKHRDSRSKRRERASGQDSERKKQMEVILARLGELENQHVR